MSRMITNKKITNKPKKTIGISCFNAYAIMTFVANKNNFIIPKKNSSEDFMNNKFWSLL